MTSYVDDNLFPKVIMVEGGAPASPASGNQTLFVDSADHKLKRKNSSGTVTTVESSGGGTTPVLQLDYTAATDILNAASLGATTWTDINSNQSFTVDVAASLVEIVVRGGMLAGAESSPASIATRIIIDSAGTPVTKQINEQYTNSSGLYVNPLSGGPIYLPASTLTAGSHTIKVQAYANTAGGSMYLRASTNPNTEFLSIQVIEHK